MSKNRRQGRTREAATPEERRARDIRRAFVLVHAVMSGLLVLGAELGWYSLTYGGKIHFQVVPLQSTPFHPAAMPFVEQARAFIACAVISFFFTSYDLVAEADIQWPSLIVSAFALGCCGQVAWKLDRGFDRMVEGAVALDELQKIKAEQAARNKLGLPPLDIATVASALTDPTQAPIGPSATSTDGRVIASGVTSATTAAITSGSHPPSEAEDPPVKLRVDLGLKLILFASASMTLLSTYLTFFARRAP